MLPNEMQRRFETAQQLVAAGRFAEAKAEFAPVAAALPNDPGSRQFMGYVLASGGDFPGAAVEFRTALAALPPTGEAAAQIGAQLGDALARDGRTPEAETALRRAITAYPRIPAPSTALARLLTSLGRAEEADRLLAPLRTVRDVGVAEAHAEALGVLGRSAEQIEQLQRVVVLDPEDRIAWHNLAAAEGNLHHFAKAENATSSAISLGLDAPETWLVRGRALSGLDRLDEAEAAFARALEVRPHYLDALRDLAQLVWTRTGDLAAATWRLDTAIASTADNQALIVERAALAENAGDLAAAQALLTAAADAPNAQPRLKGIAAQTLIKTDPDQAARYAVEAAAAAPEADDIQRTLAEVRLAQGDPAAAAAIATGLLARNPLNQGDLALLSTARRLAGAGEGEDYAGLVQARFIDAPLGWADLTAYLADLTSALERLHHGAAHPVGQSLRGGTQTRQNLLESDDPAIRAFPAAIDGAIRAYLAHLGTGDDPLRSRNTGGYRFSGIWSVRLKGQGYHIDHVHPEGWISSACHIALPSAVQGEGREGWLKFGEPGLTTQPRLPAEHFVQPQAGKLLLFPSYLWHGTVPFSGDEPRLTIAFDLLPNA